MTAPEAVEPRANGSFAKLDRDGLVQQVARNLADAIIRGQIKPGDKVSESVIAKEMGISRAPVREAARLLESSGLVTYETNRGFFVRQITADELDQLYELRILIEKAAIARFITSGATEHLPALKAQLQVLREASKTDNMHAHIKADMDFHRIILSNCGNARYLSIFEQVAQEIELSLVVTGQLYDDPALIAETHEPLIAAIESSDAAAATAAMDYHLSEARNRVIPQFE